MSKVKLDLQHKNFAQLSTFANAHKGALVGNANFTTPTPTPVVFDASLLAYDNKLQAISEAELALEVMRAERDQLRGDLEEKLNERGTYVEKESDGEPSVILSAAMEVQANPTLTTSIDKPGGLVATMGDDTGEIDYGCNAVPKARGYITEKREHSDNAAPGAWGDTKFGTRSTGTCSGLVSGKKYAFRMKALGPNELESPWSDEVICMAP